MTQQEREQLKAEYDKNAKSEVWAWLNHLVGREPGQEPIDRAEFGDGATSRSEQ